MIPLHTYGKNATLLTYRSRGNLNSLSGGARQSASMLTTAGSMSVSGRPRFFSTARSTCSRACESV